MSKSKITRDTLVPIGLIITVVSFVVAGVWWASDITARMRNVETAVGPITQMQQDVAVIKAQLVPKSTDVSYKR